ncbi:unnamed protein product [Polarella glacialis]|uniref:Glutamate/phenylalanine/leucine/valine/L-tryptophan dehydrogenase C-terminal domain-containing protein n=1 Tax=Polarella glacialis TaxID=89957 RepID=A0A813FD19_POLGL|nr:unnamed protein product [Polarella glacialis]
MANPKQALPPSNLLASLPPAALTGLVCEAASKSDIEGVRALLSAGASINAGTAYDQRTALHLAAAAGNLTMCKFLMEECRAALQRDRFGLLPIHDAVQNGHNEVRRYLQSKRLELDSSQPGIRIRAGSMENMVNKNSSTGDLVSTEFLADLTSTVFELVVKEGVFSYTAVHSEVQHFFIGLSFHTVYFTHFTAMQIAKHVHCLIAAKHVARATDDIGGLEFDLKTEHSAFFLCTICSPDNPNCSQKRTEDKVADYLTLCMNEKHNVALTFMSSEGPAFPGGKEHLAIYNIDKGHFDVTRVSEGETSIEILASARFLKTKSSVAKEQYQVVMEDVVACRQSVVRIVPGSVYPGPHPGGFVLIFATAETVGRHYLREICQAMRFVGLVPRRFYLENFVNGVLTYSLFFPYAQESEMQQLKSTIMYSTHLRSNPGGSELVYNSVMQSTISYQCGLYLLSAVKFVFTFFPKEQYAREYTSVHKVLDQNESAQRKLESLYKLCIKDLLSTDRIYQLVHRHINLAKRFYEDFRQIATGEVKPHFNAELGTAIDTACSDPQDRQILRMFLIFNESMLMTNFFKAETPGAFAFRLNPAIVLRDRPTSLYPEVPYAIYLVNGRDFMGFHTRFREVARGGIRLIQSRDSATYARNFATLFDEGYNLAFTQQNKNKDIPEGGAKGVILPDASWPNSAGGNSLAGNSSQSPAATKSCFIRYLNALIDCMLPEPGGIYTGHMEGKAEMLFFGPDENTAGFMDLGAELAHVRGYPYWKALTTGKSTALGGIPHDTYGMTTASVHTYVTELLRELGEDESEITKFQTGGPDGDLGSNEILVSKDKTIGIVDGSGVLYDPAGLNRTELTRLATRRVMVRDFSRSFLGPGGFLVTIDETDVTLPDGSQWLTGAELRDNFHLTDFAAADLFVPCGGRPNAVTTDNVRKLFTADGKPKFRMVVEGANLFLSDGARRVLETAGVHLFKDACTNKGGVTSSSLEVFAALALPVEQHSALMCYDPKHGGSPPAFYTEYVQQILDIIIENAQQEFRAVWTANQKDGVSKVEATKLISGKITRMQDSIMDTFQKMSESERDHLVRKVLSLAVPPAMIENLGVDGIVKNVPESYITALVSAWIASRFVYKNGINTSEVSFFFFLKSLLSHEGGGQANGVA